MTKLHAIRVYLLALEAQLVRVTVDPYGNDSAAAATVSPVTIRHLDRVLREVRRITDCMTIQTFDVADESPDSATYPKALELIPQVRLAIEAIEDLCFNTVPFGEIEIEEIDADDDDLEDGDEDEDEDGDELEGGLEDQDEE